VGKKREDAVRPDAPGQQQIPEMVEADSTPDERALSAVERLMGGAEPAPRVDLKAYAEVSAEVAKTVRRLIDAGAGGSDAVRAAIDILDLMS